MDRILRDARERGWSGKGEREGERVEERRKRRNGLNSVLQTIPFNLVLYSTLIISISLSTLSINLKSCFYMVL